MRKFMHYGKEVIYQQIGDVSFRDLLDKEGIKYVDLPLLEDDVLMYEKDGKTRYVCIVRANSPDEYIENTYMTSEIPVDLSWRNLMLDCKRQKSGEEPMKLKTKAKLLCEKATDMAMKSARERAEPGSMIWTIPEVDPRDFRLALIALGYNIDIIMEMDHHDVDEKFLEDMQK